MWQMYPPQLDLGPVFPVTGCHTATPITAQKTSLIGRIRSALVDLSLRTPLSRWTIGGLWCHDLSMLYGSY